jgi:hypothetical protein
MPTNEHLLLCGGATAQGKGDATRLQLNLHGTSTNVRLEIADISRRLIANISPVHADLLEIASYIYAADSAIPRGGSTDAQLGARWRRKLRLVIPARKPELWSSEPVIASLIETVSFLSDDDYEFEFCLLKNPPTAESYFQLSGATDVRFTPDEVILFSGGLDSFAGTIEELGAHNKRVALVSHRSAGKIRTYSVPPRHRVLVAARSHRRNEKAPPMSGGASLGNLRHITGATGAHGPKLEQVPA